MKPFYVEPRVTIFHANCKEVLAGFHENFVDAVVTDPPYGLEFMGKEWDRLGWQAGGGFSKPGIGERNTEWVSFSATSRFGAVNPTCAECGGRLRGARKCLCEQPHDHWKPIGKRRDPDNEGLPNDATSSGMRHHMEAMQAWHHSWAAEALRVLKPGGHLVAFGGERTYHRLACAVEDAGFEVRFMLLWLQGQGFPKSLNMNGEWEGWGTALKPAASPILLARKPLSEPTVAANVARWGTGALNLGACRIALDPIADASQLRTMNRSKRVSKDGWGMSSVSGDTPLVVRLEGRWPANLILDEDAARMLDEQSGKRKSGDPAVMRLGENRSAAYGKESRAPGTLMTGYGDTGGASRFFYVAKASAKDRNGTRHPTVKPVDLMKWLVTLVTPPCGLVLDPFMGSGPTILAARDLGFRVVGIEKGAEYCRDAVRRL